MTIIKGNLILKKNTTFKESIKVEGDIKGMFDLKVAGNIVAENIDAWNIDARNIDAWNIDARNIVAENIDAENIDAWNIDARNIDAWNIDARNIVAENIDAENIDARNIDAWDIICEKRIKKFKTAKTICRVYLQSKSKLSKKEQDIN